MLSLLLASSLMIGFAGVALADSDEGHHGGGVRTVPFSATGVPPLGQETSLSLPGCQFTGSCTVESKGTALVEAGAYTFPASYDSVVTIDYAHVTVNGANFCAPASGIETLKSIVHPADTISKHLEGTLCGGNAVGAPHFFTGTYVITGGTGRFHGATGTGTVAATDNGLGAILTSHEIGTIRYHGARNKGDDDNDHEQESD